MIWPMQNCCCHTHTITKIVIRFNEFCRSSKPYYFIRYAEACNNRGYDVIMCILSLCTKVRLFLSLSLSLVVLFYSVDLKAFSSSFVVGNEWSLWLSFWMINKKSRFPFSTYYTQNWILLEISWFLDFLSSLDRRIYYMVEIDYKGFFVR